MGKKHKPKFRPMQVVICDHLVFNKEHREQYDSLPDFKTGDALLHLGEVLGMPGHIAVVTRAGKVHWGVHDDRFRQPREDEV